MLLEQVLPDAHTVPAARARGRVAAISLLLNKEMAKENQPRDRMSLGTLQCATEN